MLFIPVEDYCQRDEPLIKCRNHGECIPALQGFNCNCTAGFEGEQCGDGK